jgi:hypothetical protein
LFEATHEADKESLRTTVYDCRVLDIGSNPVLLFSPEIAVTASKVGG